MIVPYYKKYSCPICKDIEKFHLVIFNATINEVLDYIGPTYNNLSLLVGNIGSNINQYMPPDIDLSNKTDLTTISAKIDITYIILHMLCKTNSHVYYVDSQVAELIDFVGGKIAPRVTSLILGDSEIKSNFPYRRTEINLEYPRVIKLPDNRFVDYTDEKYATYDESKYIDFINNIKILG